MRRLTFLAPALLASTAIGCATAETGDDDDDAPIVLVADAPLHDATPRIDGSGIDGTGIDAQPCEDLDGDGFGVGHDCLGPDCNESNPNINAGAEEACNGVDDDCDTAIDNGLEVLACGTGICYREVEGCIDGVPQACVPGSPGAETCNNLDDDCDSVIDDGLGNLTCGTGACYREVAACVAGVPQTCTPGPAGVEICNNVDDDCDGATDDGLGTLSCGVGPCLNTVNACVDGVPQTCTPLPAGTETCNGVDDDCDGTVDDGACGPANDARPGAIVVALATSEVVVTGSTTGATHDGPSVTCGCTSSYGDVWYRFDVPANGAVYLDTAGSSYDTALIVTDSTGAAVPAQAANGRDAAGLCNDDGGCPTAGDWTSGLQSRTWGWFSAGTYHVVVGGCGTGSFTLRFQYARADSSAYFYSGRLSGDSSTSTVLVGTSVQTSGCGGSASGEDARWFTTCGANQFFSLCRSDTPAPAWQRSEDTGGTTLYDAALYIRSARTGAEAACNDDGLSTGATDCRGYWGTDEATLSDTVHWGSRLNDVAAPRGLNVVFVDERSGGSGMNYRLRHIVRDY